MVYRRQRTYPVQRKDGYRSQFEADVAQDMEVKGHSYEFETTKVPYIKPAQGHRYLIDFVLPNGITIEAKGEFTPADRKKHLLIKEQWPDLDLRFVFGNPGRKLSKKSKTTYAAWCEKHGFPYAKKTVPEKWLKEKVNRRSLQSITEIKKSQTYKGGKVYAGKNTKGNDS